MFALPNTRSSRSSIRNFQFSIFNFQSLLSLNQKSKIKNQKSFLALSTFTPHPSSIIHHPSSLPVTVYCLLITLPLAATAASDLPKSFPSPQAAVAALSAAVNSKNADALHDIFGPEADDVQNPDRVQATNEFNTFAEALNATNRLVKNSDTNYALEIGTNFWPFPIPIVNQQGHWLFDTRTGKEELFNRRIGRNELNTLETIRAYVDAQREYASRDRNGDEVLQFAQRIFSSPGKKDGLYWPQDLDGEESPLGLLIAEAQGEGYTPKSGEAMEPPEPFHGYYFKILPRQGKHAPGGEYNYVINGRMIAGFALIAWPATYDESGIMTFIVNQQGRVYQKDLGPKTDKLAPKITVYDPDSTWQLSPD
jgi:hypothetical protein